MIVKTRTNVYDFNFHLVWVTKYRKEIFTTIEKQNAMQDILTHICDEHDIVIQSLQVMPDHIHMLISFNPKPAARITFIKSQPIWLKVMTLSF